MGKASRSKSLRRDAAPRGNETKPVLDDEGGYWHGGWPGLEVDTVLVGSAEASQCGVDPARYAARHANGEPGLTNPNRVYFSSRRGLAKAFAFNDQVRDVETGIVFQRGALYRVEPIGDVEIDPDFQNERVSWCAPRARIVAVEDANVMLDAYGACEQVGPYLTWADGSPVYSDEGEYLLSPEQIEAGQAQSPPVSHLPWTPLEHINATLTHSPSGDRPIAKDHHGIAHGAAEAAAVITRHSSRTTKLVQEGVEFSSDYAPVRDAVNALIAPTELSVQDERGAVVALHPRDGVIGACVVTAMQMEDQLVMFLDRVAVDPDWRRQGLGSVMLATAQQLLPSPVYFAAGHCTPEIAPFFAQMGYTVLNAGVQLLLPVYKFEKDLQFMQVSDDCWFYRQGRV